MKKRIPIYFLLFLFSTYCVSYSQTLESIKNADTIYIYFDHGEFQKVKTPYINSNDILEESKIYEIKFDEKNYVNFSERKYFNYDDADAKKEMEKIIVKPSFLKENKDFIIDIEFIKKYGLEKVFYLIQHKGVYLIDKRDIKKKKVVLKRVAFSHCSYSPIM